MRRFNYSKYYEKLWDSEILNLVSKLHEYKIKQEQLLDQKPKVLEKFKDLTKFKSTVSSNRIEGITPTDKRIKDIIFNNKEPKTEDECEIAGYNEILSFVSDSYNYIPLSSDTICKLHQDLYKYSNQTSIGEFKKKSNSIIKIKPVGTKILVFKPLSPSETPLAVHEICESFSKSINENKIDPLILIPVFIHDFLCIHPFTDGNGRLSRILTILLLNQSGYIIGNYVSIEKIIEDTQEWYYDSLNKSGIGWYENEEDKLSFIKYFLNTIIFSYKELERKVKLIDKNIPAKEMVKQVITDKVGKITKSELVEKLPSLATSTIEKSLKELVEDGFIERHHKGKNTFYVQAY